MNTQQSPRSSRSPYPQRPHQRRAPTHSTPVPSVPRRSIFTTLGPLGLVLAGAIAGGFTIAKDTALAQWAGLTVASSAASRQAEANQINQAQQEGAAHERQRITAEISQLGGVTLTDALTAAHSTANATQAIVVPLATVLQSLSPGDADQALKRLQDSLVAAQVTCQQQGVDIADLDTLHTLLHTWQSQLPALAMPLTSFADPTTTAHNNDSMTYLNALRQRITTNRL